MTEVTTEPVVEVEVKDNRTPVIFPLLNLLRSRKFIVALAAIISSILVSKIPELRPYTAEIMTGIITLGLVLVGGIAFEDALIQGRVEAINTEVDSVGVEIKEVLRVALEEKLTESEKTEEEKQVLRDLLERFLRDIPNGEVTVKV